MARPLTPRFRPVLCAFVALVVSAPALADGEPEMPDPPGAITFDTIALRTVPVPNEKIPDSCDRGFRSGLESSFQSVWQQCRSIGAAEPSDCQRALFSRCTDLAASLQKMEAQSCTAMLGEQNALSGFKSVGGQSSAQDSTADLNARAYVATQRVIKGLENSQKQLDAHRKTAFGTLQADACAGSPVAATYGRAEGVVVSAMNRARQHLGTVIQRKKAAAATFAKNSGKSQANLAALVSAAPGKITGATASQPAASTITSATSTGGTVYTGTVVETVISTPTPTTTVITTSTSVGTPGTVSTYTAPPLPRAYVPVFPDDTSYASHKTNWVPILAVGVPAAILTGIAISKLSKNGLGGGGGGGSDGGGGDSGGGSQPPSGSGPQQLPPATGPAPGSEELSALGMSISPSFTDRQRAIVATAVGKIPACYRYKLRGLRVTTARLGGGGGGTCVAGLTKMEDNAVYLNPNCRVSIGLTVHEYFHVLGMRDRETMHQSWAREVIHENWGAVKWSRPSCPVSAYGATNHVEEFAETGRLLMYPDAGENVYPGARRQGACVDVKFNGLTRMLSNCPGGGR